MGSESGDEKCSICLGPVEQPAKPDTCTHVFCYDDLKRWAERTNNCPLCKEEFREILTARRDGKWTKREKINAPVCPDFIQNLGLQDQWPAIWALPTHERERTQREFQERLQRQQRIRRAQREAAFAQATAEDIRRRRAVYRNERYCVHKLVRDFSIEFYRANEGVTHRLIPWIKREMVAIFGARNPRNQQFINSFLEMLMRIIRCHGLQSNQFRTFVQSKMDRYSEHFIHELIGFASARQHTITQYERDVCYMRRDQSRECAQMLRNRSSHLTPGAPQRLTSETPIRILSSDEDDSPPTHSSRLRNSSNYNESVLISSDEEGNNDSTPERIDQPTTSRRCLRRSRNARTTPITVTDMHHISNDPIGESDPLLSAARISNIDAQGMKPNLAEGSRLSRMSHNTPISVHSRILDERDESARLVERNREVIHVSRLEMLAEHHQRQIVVTISDESGSSDEDVNPQVPHSAFIRNINAHAVVIDSNSETDSDILEVPSRSACLSRQSSYISSNEPTSSNSNDIVMIVDDEPENDEISENLSISPNEGDQGMPGLEQIEDTPMPELEKISSKNLASRSQGIESEDDSDEPKRNIQISVKSRLGGKLTTRNIVKNDEKIVRQEKSVEDPPVSTNKRVVSLKRPASGCKTDRDVLENPETPTSSKSDLYFTTPKRRKGRGTSTFLSSMKSMEKERQQT